MLYLILAGGLPVVIALLDPVLGFIVLSGMAPGLVLWKLVRARPSLAGLRALGRSILAGLSGLWKSVVDCLPWVVVGIMLLFGMALCVPLLGGGGGGYGRVIPSVTLPYEGTAVYGEDGWSITDTFAFNEEALGVLKAQIKDEVNRELSRSSYGDGVVSDYVTELRRLEEDIGTADGVAKLLDQQAGSWDVRIQDRSVLLWRERHVKARPHMLPAFSESIIYIELPHEELELINFTITTGQLQLRTPHNYVRQTSPAATRTSEADEERLASALNASYGEKPSVRVQLLSPAFRNPLGASMAYVTTGGL